MPFTVRPHRCFRLPLLAIRTFSVLALCLPTFVEAETKVIVSEGTYLMGDGETPYSAEAMVLQKAKQIALEQAGTYVESYTHTRNLDLTVDEIKTIAGGVMQTEVVERKRTQEGDGVRFHIKIKALVTTDRIEDLARQKQLKTLAAENKKLQDDVVRLTRELEEFNRQIARARTNSEREAVLEKIRTVEKEFRQVQSSETALYRRLVSGEELSAQVDKAFQDEQRRREVELKRIQSQQEALDRLLATLERNGHTITISPPETKVSVDEPDAVTLGFKVQAKASQEAKRAIEEVRKAYGTDLPEPSARRIGEVLEGSTLVLTVLLKDGREFSSTKPGFNNYRSPRSWDLRQIVREKPTEGYITVRVPRSVVSQIASVEGKIIVQKGYAVKSTPEYVFNSYWDRVEAIIKSQWEPPPIDVSGSTFSTVVRFRLYRNGTIKDIGIQQSSGNDYFDMAAQRAVQKPRLFPPFPAEITEPYHNVEMTFQIGETNGERVSTQFSSSGE